MRYASVCSGIEAATTAWHPLGWQPQFFAEIERFPCAVLDHYYPDVPNLGDMTKFADWPDYAIDLLVGGTPCQSFSVAGLREGLRDPRGNLALTFLAIAARYRPRWVVWENVPGVHSSWSDEATHPATEESHAAIEEARRAAIAAGINLGADFGIGDFEEVDQRNDFDSFLAGLAELGYGVATRVLDAEFVRVESHPRAVPQRRRRVFVVGYLGDWRRAAAVLLERESLRGDPPPRREAGKGTTHEIAPSLTSSGRGVERAGDTRGQDAVIAVDGYVPDIVHQAMSSKWSKGSSGPAGDEIRDLVAHPVTDIAGCLNSAGGHAVSGNCIQDSDQGYLLPMVSHPLKADGHDGSEDGTGRGVPLVPVAFNARQDPIHSSGAPLPLDTDGTTQAIAVEDVAQTLTYGPSSKASHGKKSGTDRETMIPVAFQTRIARNGRGTPEEVCPTLNGTNAGETSDMRPCVATGMAVRRLTPLECERLMGFPDGYTAIPKAKDGPRYKALGNSKAINVVRWLGERIQLVDQIS